MRLSGTAAKAVEYAQLRSAVTIQRHRGLLSKFMSLAAFPAVSVTIRPYTIYPDLQDGADRCRGDGSEISIASRHQASACYKNSCRRLWRRQKPHMAFSLSFWRGGGNEAEKYGKEINSFHPVGYPMPSRRNQTISRMSPIQPEHENRDWRQTRCLSRRQWNWAVNPAALSSADVTRSFDIHKIA